METENKETCRNEWEDEPMCYGVFKCSKCGTEARIEMNFLVSGGDYTETEPSYCPNCGREVIY